MDLTGIKYRIFSLGVSFLCMAILVLIFSKFWNSKKRDKRGIFIGLIVLVFSIANICYYGNILYNPTISYHDGYFVEERRNAAITPYTHEYIFTNENDTKPIFYLDNFSKKRIYNKPLVENHKYRIYYEERQKIIVGITLIDEQPIITIP